jgi:rhodanese-related sulfurtransferase
MTNPNDPGTTSPPAARAPGRIAAPELKQRIDAGERFTLLDVRSPAEHAGSRLRGALNVPIETLASSLAAIPTNLPIVVVCQGGTRAALAAPALRDRAAVLVLDGGLAAWRKCGFEVEGSAGRVWPLERQVRLVAGLLVLLGCALGLAVAPGFFGIAAFIGAGLAFSGITGFCGMALLLAKLPWNRRAFGACAPPPAPGSAAAPGRPGAP